MAEKEYIEREAALESVREKVLICESLPDTIAKDASLFTLASMNDSLKSIPAADVRPVVRGRWEEVEVTWLADVEDQPDAIASMFCPKCKRFANHVYNYGDPTDGMNFCPNCGADMRGEQDV